MLNPNRRRTIHHPQRAGRIRLSTVLGTAVFGGLAITSLALLAPLQENLRVSPSDVHATQVAPAPAIEVAPEPVVESPPVIELAPPVEVALISQIDQIVDAEPTPIGGARPVVALAHDDLETDYAALGAGLLDAGEMEAGFIALRKHLFTAEPTARRLLRIARVGRQIGDYAVAEQALLDAAAIDPSASSVSVEQARLHIATGDLDAARDAARQGIRIDAEDAMAWNLAGRVAMMQSEWERGEVALTKAVELEPSHPMLHNNLGLLYVKTQQADAAIDALETAVELFADDVPHFVYNNLGLAYEQAEVFEDARDAFEQALVQSPKYARARLNLERVVHTLVKLDEEAETSEAAGEALGEAVDDDTSGPSGATE